MATSYEKIYDRFTQKITDFNLVEIDDYSLDKMLQSWLNTAVVKTRKCQHDLSQRDEELQVFKEDLSDLEIELLDPLIVTKAHSFGNAGNSLTELLIS